MDEVVEPHIFYFFYCCYSILLFLLFFQQGNARAHIAKRSIDRHAEANASLLLWPPGSPDLSPLKHVWDIMGTRLRNSLYDPQSLHAIHHEFQIVWDTVPQEEIVHLLELLLPLSEVRAP